MFISLIIARFFGYLFQIYVARAVGPEEYGVFGSLFSIFLILTVPTGTIQTVVSRFTSEYNIGNNYSLIKILFLKSIKRLGSFGIIGVIIFAVFSYPIALFLKIPSVFPIIILGFSIIWSFLTPIPEGTLIGLQRFKSLGIATILHTTSRFLFMIILLSLGFKLNGVIFSFAIAPIVPFLFCYFKLKDIMKLEIPNTNIDVPSIYNYSYPILVVVGLSALLQNSNILAVKHFFSSYQTGIYVSALNISMIIIFLSTALTSSQFPKVSSLHSSNLPSFHILKESLVYMIVFSFIFIFSCTFLKEYLVLFLFGNEYVEASRLLPILSVTMSIFAVSTLLLSYLMALKEFIFIKKLLLISIIYIFTLFVVHSSINTIINITLITFLGVISLSIWSIYKIKTK